MSNNSQQNMITQGTTLVGDVLSEGDFRVEGNIKGNIKTTGRIVVGKTGVVNGSLEGEDADFEGGFTGKLKLSGKLTLRSSAYIEGEVEIGKLADIVVLDRNLFKIPKHEIHSVKVNQTIFNGKIVYEKD